MASMTNATTINQPRSKLTKIKILKDLDAISRQAADEIVQQAHRMAASAGRFALALSGGSTPGRLYERLGREPAVRNRLPWSNIHFFWGDERHVPPDDPQSNYRMACDTLFASAPVPMLNIHRVRAEESDAALAAENYERELKAFFGLEPGQMPRFDCILLGMGSEGHTASLFPGTKALHEKKRLVVANWVEKLQTHRITLTAPVLNNAALIIFLVSGAEKAKVLEKILAGDYRPDLLPAQLIRPENGRLLWLVDEAAADCLSMTVKS
jgi:6-phosphogluconolactonase